MTRLPSVLVGAGIAAIGIAILLIGGALVDHWPFAFDRTIILGLRSWHGPGWLREAARDVTALGSPTVLTTIVTAVTGLLLVQRHRLTALSLLAASLSGASAVALLKTYVARPRPEVVEHWTVVSNQSFPSGHAASSAVIYLTLAAVVTQIVPAANGGRAVRGYVLGVAILLVGAIGVSRVYLGVHWPSDVLAGWSFGTLWAIGWWRATAAARASLRRAQ